MCRIYDFGKNPAMRANDIEGKIMALFVKARMFRHKRGKHSHFSASQLQELFDRKIWDPSIDSHEVRKIKELLDQLTKCPHYRVNAFNLRDGKHDPPD